MKKTSMKLFCRHDLIHEQKALLENCIEIIYTLVPKYLKNIYFSKYDNSLRYIVIAHLFLSFYTFTAPIARRFGSTCRCNHFRLQIQLRTDLRKYLASLLKNPLNMLKSSSIQVKVNYSLENICFTFFLLFFLERTHKHF